MAQRSALQIANSRNNMSSSIMVRRSSQQQEQIAVLAVVFSHWSNLKAGVPECSILSPFLFHIYIIDIVRSINSHIRLFVDDTSLYSKVKNPIQSATVLNSDISQIYTSAPNWLVTFNPSKTDLALFM